MKVLRGTLTFVLGMVIGIILFVLAIGGTVLIIGTSITVGNLQSSFTNTEVISSDSELYNKTVLDAVKGVLSDVQNFDKLSLKTLYEHYGIKLLNGISGIDFTEKEFYSTPIPDLVNDLSIIVNSFTLKDISKIAGVDFSKYGLPILTDNLDNNIATAIDNILSSVNGDLSIRVIKNSLGIDLGTEDNSLIATLQDVALSQFGNVLNVLRVNLLLEANTDTFILKNDDKYYVKADYYERITQVEANAGSTVLYGVDVIYENSLLGGKDTDGDGTADKMNFEPTRYIKRNATVDGEETEEYVVDNSKTYEDISNGAQVYRHVIYKRATTEDFSNGNQLYMMCYANRIDRIVRDNAGLFVSINLVEKGLMPLSELDFSEKSDWTILDNPMDKDSTLKVITSSDTDGEYSFDASNDNENEDNSSYIPIDVRTKFQRVQVGTSQPLLQKIAFMTISELQKADNILKSIRIGDVINITENSAKFLITLQDSTLETIGEDIRKLTIDQIIDTDKPDASPIMKALANHGCTIDDLATITNELTLGELMNINFDVYEESADGEFAFVPFFVKYNKYIHSENEQRYALESNEYVADENGNFVRTGFYTLYGDSMGDVKRYNLVTKGDSIIMQSLARRGCTITDISSLLDNLYISEVVRIDGNSAHIFKSLARRGIKLGEFDTIIDKLEIGEIIEITGSTAKIMKSLAARHCTISDLGTVANDLSLGEMIDIKLYSYTENANGKYVCIEDENSFTLFDENSAAYANSTRYTKNKNGEFVEAENGEFVHAKYFTLYNPAEHATLTRYTRTDSQGASSALLQRFAGATLGTFSTAFEGLKLSDVMNMDTDIYAVVDMSYIEYNENERFFYYDDELDVYRVIHREEILKNPNRTYYHIAQSGDSTAIMKKLAFVKIDNMSSAMNVIIDDMMLSEIISVYTESAVELGTFDGNFDESARYFMEYGKNGNGYTNGDAKYVYVYDTYGDYAKANFRPVPITDSIATNHVYYEYVRLSDVPESDRVLKLADIQSKGNLYYFNYDTNAYERNLVLCTYMLTRGTQYYSHLYFRQIKEGATAADVDNKTVFDGKVYTYMGATKQYGVYVRDNFNGYMRHIPNEPAFADRQLYTFEKSEAGMTYYVDKNDVQKLYNALATQGFVSTGVYTEIVNGKPVSHNSPIFFSLKECENVYILSPNGDFVYVDGQYMQYNASLHTDPTLQRFVRKRGYVATINEVSYTNNGVRTSDFEVVPINSFIREKSTPVLRMLARGTISELTGIISNATVGDIIEAETGSLFDNEVIKKAKISEIGKVFGEVLTTMTISDLLDWSHVTKVNEYVRIALENVTIQTLFSSLKFNETTHEITVDMFSIYGYDTKVAEENINKGLPQ